MLKRGGVSGSQCAAIGIFIASAGIYMELVLLVCLASLFSSFTTPTLSAIFTLSMFLIGHVSKDLMVFGERASSRAIRCPNSRGEMCARSQFNSALLQTEICSV